MSLAPPAPEPILESTSEPLQEPGAPDHREKLHRRLVAAALPHVPFDGWSDAALRRAAHDAGIDPALLPLAFPRGPIDAVEAFWAEADWHMAETASAQELAALSLRGRIIFLVRLYLEHLTPEREAVRRALTLQALPLHPGSGPACLARTVDALWRAAGDQATGFDFYTKRALLAGVFSATVLFWLDDRSPDQEDSWAFLERRIADVLRLGMQAARLRALGGALAAPLGLLGRLRYRDWEGLGEGLEKGLRAGPGWARPVSLPAPPRARRRLYSSRS